MAGEVCVDTTLLDVVVEEEEEVVGVAVGGVG